MDDVYKDFFACAFVIESVALGIIAGVAITKLVMRFLESKTKK